MKLTEANKAEIAESIYENYGGCSECLYGDAESLRETALADALYEILDDSNWFRKLGLKDFDDLESNIDNLVHELELVCPECGAAWDDPWIDLGHFGTQILFEDEIQIKPPKKTRKNKKAKQKDFFKRQSSSSKIKAEIVSKYFFGWANVMLTQASKIAYVDFYSGPGVYDDGSKSTPILILDGIAGKTKFQQAVVMLLNDISKAATNRLTQCVDSHAASKLMKLKPTVDTSEIQSETAEQFKKVNLVPTLSFIDPFGFKGLSLELIQAMIKDWGSECIFFFNYQSVNRHLSNQHVKDHMDKLFGTARAAALRQEIQKISVDQPGRRQQLIVDNLLQAIVAETDGKYCVKFEFQSPYKSRTSHYIVFVTKNPLGAKIMKGVMAPYGSSIEGISSFSFDPKGQDVQMNLWDKPKGLDEISQELCTKFAGQNLKVSEIVLQYCAGDNLFVESNCKKALIQLEEQGSVLAEPPLPKRRKIKGLPTMGDNVIVRFPECN